MPVVPTMAARKAGARKMSSGTSAPGPLFASTRTNSANATRATTKAAARDDRRAVRFDGGQREAAQRQRAERLGRRIEAAVLRVGRFGDRRPARAPAPRRRTAPRPGRCCASRSCRSAGRRPSGRSPSRGRCSRPRCRAHGRARASSRHTTRMMASEAGTDSAAPRPASARPAISTPIDGATAHNNEAAVKIADADHEDAAPSVEIGQQAAGQQQHGIDEVVGVEHPLQGADAGVEIVADRPRREIDHGHVDLGHQHGETEREQSEVLVVRHTHTNARIRCPMLRKGPKWRPLFSPLSCQLLRAASCSSDRATSVALMRS